MNTALRITVSILIFTLLCLAIRASNNNYYVGPRAIAMGNASLTFENTFSNFHNQAGLGFLREFSAGVAYRNNYLLQETGLKSLAVAIPIQKFGVIGMSVNSFGFSAYGEHKFGLAYSKSFGDVLSMGIQIDYLQTQFAEPYGSRGVVAGEFGVLAKLNAKTKIGAHIYNPTRAYLDKPVNERLPTILKVGMSYSFSESLLTTLEMEKSLDFKPNIKAGLEYLIDKKFSIRGGVNSFPVKVCFGGGMKLGNLDIDLASEYQQNLGFVPSFGIRYKFNKKEPDAN